MDDDENIEDPPPPSADRVARRALVLSVVVCRGFVEQDRANPTEAKKLAERSFNWLDSLDLSAELSDWERRVLTNPFGSLPERDCINATWLSEGLVILAWALGRREIPDYQVQCDPGAIATALGFLQPRAETALAGPRLRPDQELRSYNEFVYNLHWRLRDFSLAGRAYNFRSLTVKAGGEPVLRYELELAGDDLAVGGCAIVDAPEAERQLLTSVTQERHRASNWLVGYASADFYQVTTDT
jgi:hypothetical protein